MTNYFFPPPQDFKQFASFVISVIVLVGSGIYWLQQGQPEPLTAGFVGTIIGYWTSNVTEGQSSKVG